MKIANYIYNNLKIEKKKIRFMFIGGINTLFGVSIFPILYFMLSSIQKHYIFILFFSHIIAMNFSYLTNKILVFRTKGNFFQEYPKFCGFQFFIFFLNLGPFTMLVEAAHLKPILAQIILTSIAVVVSYIWYNRFTFIGKIDHT